MAVEFRAALRKVDINLKNSATHIALLWISFRMTPSTGRSKWNALTLSVLWWLLDPTVHLATLSNLVR